MELKQLTAAMEAVLFAHAEPLSAVKLSEILELEKDLVEKLLLKMRDEYEAANRGIQLISLEDSWQLTTKQQYSEQVKKAMDTRRNTPLSSAALEVLAIIAYNQPVSRSFIEQVRGVDSSSTVINLAEKGLVAEAGRLDLPGRPIAYKTTDAFLRAFGISSLAELPALHNEEAAQEDDSALYNLHQSEGEIEVDDEAATRALRGGVFIEGIGGSADLMGKDE